ncbi:helix-turn-helix transcriptional regulator [Rhizobium sp. FKY42]|uniref:AraC family transcriptional regulator n=1 Tax=Rhizobium sp. FKY42 TaxID=2562310 RepID=UPI001FEE008F|nr:helix-turn-helix transcriptional regulator [Rhizobium sp. FKY42]
MLTPNEFQPTVRSVSGKDPAIFAHVLELTGCKATVSANSPCFYFEQYITKVGSVIAGSLKLKGECTITLQDPTDRLVVFIPVSGSARLHIAGQCIDAGEDVIVLAQARQIAGLQLGPDRTHMVLEIPQTDLRRKLSELLGCAIHERLQFQLTLKIESEAGRLLNLLTKALVDGLTSESNLSSTHRSLTDSILCCLVELVWHNYTRSVENTNNLATPKYIERAISFMQANLPNALTVECIATEVNVSPRTLQQGFKQFRGTTPMAYLKELRLQAAHRELEWAPPGVSVSDIGRRWGFVHLGRFAAEYRERFGRAPSGTLKGF